MDLTSEQLGGSEKKAAEDELDEVDLLEATIDPRDVESLAKVNEIKAERRGKIIEILVENGQPVEFGQPLFRIETEG